MQEREIRLYFTSFISRESEEPPKMKGAVEPLVNNMHSEPVNIKQEIYPEEESEIISPSCLVNDVTSFSGTRRGSTASTADMDGVLRTPCKTETNNIKRRKKTRDRNNFICRPRLHVLRDALKNSST